MIIPKKSLLAAAFLLACSGPGWAQASKHQSANSQAVQKMTSAPTAADKSRECASQLRRSQLPAEVQIRIARDCENDPGKFAQFASRPVPRSPAGNTFAANNKAEGPCSSCTAYCQTITFLNTYDWGADLGGGMSPSECADAAAARCGGAFNSLITGWQCAQ